jgi:hypothetical protein
MRFLSHRSTSWVLILGCIALLAGCSESGPARYRIQGTVEFDGRPVPAGTIYFDPDSSKGNKGPQGFATITDGKFDTDIGGKGRVGGPMTVRINGLASLRTTTDDDTPIPPLFPEFIESVELDRSDDMRGFIVPKDYAGPGKPAQDEGAATDGPATEGSP